MLLVEPCRMWPAREWERSKPETRFFRGDGGGGMGTGMGGGPIEPGVGGACVAIGMALCTRLRALSVSSAQV